MPNFDLTIEVPVVMNSLENQIEEGGTAIGDLLTIVKYRLYRRDSERADAVKHLPGKNFDPGAQQSKFQFAISRVAQNSA